MASENFNRIMDLYDSVYADSLVDALTAVLKTTNTDYTTAYRKAAIIVHAQKGRGRRIMTESQLVASPEVEQNNYLSDVISDELKNLLNRYITFVQDQQKDDVKVKTLIIYLITKQLSGILLDLSFNEHYRQIITEVLVKILDAKDSIFNSIVEYFKEKGKPRHAEIAEEVGFPILESQTKKMLPIYFPQSELNEETTSKEDIQFMIDRRGDFLDYTTKPKFGLFYSIIDISESTAEKRLSTIKKELIALSNSAEIIHLNEFLLNRPV